MVSKAGSGLHFDFEWRISLFTALMLPLMISLGIWQLHRADEKTALAAAFEARQQQPPATLAALWGKPVDVLAYAPVQLRGHFLPNEYFLLDNQVQGGLVGYNVLGVMQLAEGAGSVLVNRGWVAGSASRQSLPQVPEVEGSVQITGHIYVAPGSPFLLAEQQLDEGWPKRIQAVEMDKLIPAITALQAGEVFPYPVYIDADARGALAVNWQVVNTSPEKHQAYAVQWFAMAATLLLIFLLRSSNIWQVLTGSRRADE